MESLEKLHPIRNAINSDPSLESKIAYDVVLRREGWRKSRGKQ